MSDRSHPSVPVGPLTALEGPNPGRLGLTDPPVGAMLPSVVTGSGGHCWTAV